MASLKVNLATITKPLTYFTALHIGCIYLKNLQCKQFQQREKDVFQKFSKQMMGLK